MALPMRLSNILQPSVFRCLASASAFQQCRLPGARPKEHIQRLTTDASEKKEEPLTVRSQTDEGVRTILLNDPKRRNALSLDMLQSLKEDLMHGVNGEDLRVIVIASAGPVFSSGHNLKELTTEHGRDHHVKVMQTCSQVMMLIQDMPVPVIAQVQGLATAAGCQLVASCDIAIASEKAAFATPGVNIGLFCSTPGVALGRAVPRKLALEMLFTGEPISAKVALKHGLVSKVVPHEHLEDEMSKVTEKICDASRSVIALGKACFNSQMRKTRAEAYRQAEEVMVQNLGLLDGQEGLQAFIDKRHPVWTHNFDRVPDK